MVLRWATSLALTHLRTSRWALMATVSLLMSRLSSPLWKSITRTSRRWLRRLLVRLATIRLLLVASWWFFATAKNPGSTWVLLLARPTTKMVLALRSMTSTRWCVKTTLMWRLALSILLVRLSRVLTLLKPMVRSSRMVFAYLMCMSSVSMWPSKSSRIY